MTGRLQSAIGRLLDVARRQRSRFRVRMTTRCREQAAQYLRTSTQRGHEGIVYFVGLTNGMTTTALYAMLPEVCSTSRSVDVSAPQIGKIIRSASEAGLQVVGQLHTHPADAYHSEGDLVGMRIRHPGYFSVVLPDYGAQLPTFRHSHILMWTKDGFREINTPVELIDVLAP